MKIKEMTFIKHYKKGLPNYSSVDAGFSVTVCFDERTPTIEEVHDFGRW